MPSAETSQWASSSAERGTRTLSQAIQALSKSFPVVLMPMSPVLMPGEAMSTRNACGPTPLGTDREIRSVWNRPGVAIG